MLVSFILKAFSASFANACSSGIACLNLKKLPILSKDLASCESLYARYLPCSLNIERPLPTPYTNGVNNKDSVPNLNLFINLLPASSSPDAYSSLSNCVGPI